MISKPEILNMFELFSGGTGGIDNWLGSNTCDEVFKRLTKINSKPLCKEELNQLLILSHEAGVSEGFFKYYWLSVPPSHPYDVTSIPDYEQEWTDNSKIQSLNHLRWGLYRLYVDSLLYFGNIRTGYRYFRTKTLKELETFFQLRTFDTTKMIKRGHSLPLMAIPKDNRYLISEMACKSYDSSPGATSELKQALIDAWKDHKVHGGGRVSIRDLLDGTYNGQKHVDINQQLLFSAEDILDEEIKTDQDIETKYTRVAESFFSARNMALQNTRYYLSMVNDLDVYVATSMRTREDFRKMADICEKVFSDERLRKLNLRYFDPTLSAADGHEDKGLIECLMVKTAKVLVYFAGQKDSYGKDAEAAMALSLGKPVIFFCDEKQRQVFIRDVHPLSRLIDFDTGVAVGAIVTSSIDEVIELLCKIFRNKMEYELEQPKLGYIKLKERITQSVVRLQTNDTLLRETFWNYYHEQTKCHLLSVSDFDAQIRQIKENQYV
jgi:hypothetical protein